GLSTSGAVLIGIPLGVGLARNPRWRSPVLGFVNVIQTIPSLALFAILIPLPVIGGIGASTALIALVLYSLLPVVSNTVAGLIGIDPAVREAAVAMGMTDRQLLWKVELPLALGVILTGVRVATVIGVGLATIAAAIGAGGLGMFIFRGLAMLDSRLILAGAIPAAAMALAADLILGRIERHFGARRTA
ncbi:MAG: ABC transporter permease, partial [Nitrospiraceae bacterium]